MLIKTIAKAVVMAAGAYTVFICGCAFGAYATVKKIDEGGISVDNLHDAVDAIDTEIIGFADVARS